MQHIASCFGIIAALPGIDFAYCGGYQRASQMSIKPRAPRPKNIKKVICAQKERKMSELSGSEIEWALYLDKVTPGR